MCDHVIVLEIRKKPSICSHDARQSASRGVYGMLNEYYIMTHLICTLDSLSVTPAAQL